MRLRSTALSWLEGALLRVPLLLFDDEPEDRDEPDDLDEREVLELLEAPDDDFLVLVLRCSFAASLNCS